MFLSLCVIEIKQILARRLSLKFLSASPPRKPSNSSSTSSSSLTSESSVILRNFNLFFALVVSYWSYWPSLVSFLIYCNALFRFETLGFIKFAFLVVSPSRKPSNSSTSSSSLSSEFSLILMTFNFFFALVEQSFWSRFFIEVHGSVSVLFFLELASIWFLPVWFALVWFSVVWEALWFSAVLSIFFDLD